MIHKLHLVEICSPLQDAANVWGESTEPPGLQGYNDVSSGKIAPCDQVQNCTFALGCSIAPLKKLPVWHEFAPLKEQFCAIYGANLNHIGCKVVPLGYNFAPLKVQSCTFFLSVYERGILTGL